MLLINFFNIFLIIGFKCSGVFHVKGTGWIRVIIYLIHYLQTELKGMKINKKDIWTLPDPAELHGVSLICKCIKSWHESSLINHVFLEISKF